MGSEKALAENVTVAGCRIFNSAADEGGGLCFSGAAGACFNSTVSGNVAAYGGGLYGLGPALIVEDRTVAGTTADPDGGGLWCQKGSFDEAPHA